MFATQITIDTNNFPDVWFILTHHGWIPAVVLTVFGAVLTSAVFEVYRRHYKTKQLKALTKTWTAILLSAISTVFTALGYFLLFAGSNPGILNAIPFIAEHAASIVGVAVTLYNIRLNKWYQKIADALNKWSKSADAADAAKSKSNVTHENETVPEQPAPRNVLS